MRSFLRSVSGASLIRIGVSTKNFEDSDFLILESREIDHVGLAPQGTSCLLYSKLKISRHVLATNSNNFMSAKM